MVESRILRGGTRATSRIRTLDFRRAKFCLFKELLGGIPWARALKVRGVQECWSPFTCHFLHAQEWCTSLRKKSRKGGGRPAWMSKELLAELRWKRKVHGMWNEGQTTWEEYRNVARTCRDAMRKAKAHMELNLARDIKSHNKGFFNYISSKQKTKDNVGPLLNEVNVLVTEDAEKAELLLCFSRQYQVWASGIPGPVGKRGSLQRGRPSLG